MNKITDILSSITFKWTDITDITYKWTDITKLLPDITLNLADITEIA